MTPSPRCLQGSSRKGTHGNAVPVLFYTTGTTFPFFFFLYTSIVSCNFLRKSFGYKADSLASCVHACFTRLILTLKQAPRMHQNAPLPDRKWKKFLRRGQSGAHPPHQTPPPLGRGYPFPRSHPGVPVPFHIRLEHWVCVTGPKKTELPQTRYTTRLADNYLVKFQNAVFSSNLKSFRSKIWNQNCAM